MASTARLDELKKKFDENPRRYFAPLANEHRKSGDLDQAIALCRAHLPLQPAHISGHIVLAQALFEAGSVDESRDIFLAALGFDPENLIALRYLGDIAREAQDVDTARSWYQRVLEVDPRNDEIAQMVRDLDAPRPVVADVADAEETDAAAPVVIASRPAAPAADDPRYAPLSMDNFEIGDEEVAADAPTAGETAVPAAEAEAFEVHAAWNTETPTAELPMLETPEIDPFDLHPSAGAESLFDAGTDGVADDFFLAELSGAGTTDDAGDATAPDADAAWSSEADAGAAAESISAESISAESTPAESTIGDRVVAESVAAESPAEEAQSPTAEAETVAFEEGAFYLEDEMSASGGDTVAADEPTAASSDAVAPVAERDHNAEAMALFADGATAEWQPPAAPLNEALGLEVMEFVPPSSELASTVNELTPDADPLLGRSPSLTSVEETATPAAFVTETMAELYLQQGFRSEALAVYRELLARNPADASLRERVDQIEGGSMSSIGMATLSENVVESARKRQAGRSSRSVRSFFASLAGRRAPNGGSDASQEEPTDTHAAASEASAPGVATPEMAAQDVVPIAELTGEAEAAAPSADVQEAYRQTAPMSPAEALAAFDPFADAGDGPAAPNATPGRALMGVADPESMSDAAETPVLEADPMPARRSLEDLFPDTPVTPRTDAVAQTLATAFGRDEPQGRPTRAASNELSLDHVFRGAPEGAPAPDGGFSFDQFFSDARPAGDVAAPTMAPSHGRTGGPTDTNDIEQFTAWLEGLKKK